MVISIETLALERYTWQNETIKQYIRMENVIKNTKKASKPADLWLLIEETNSHEKRTGKQLYRIFVEAYSFQSIVKLNSNENQLLKSALNDAAQLNRNDILIPCPKKFSKQLVQRLLIPLQNIQTIIITRPYYKYNYIDINDIIYFSYLEQKDEEMLETKNEDELDRLDPSIFNVVNNRTSNKENFQNVISMKAHR